MGLAMNRDQMESLKHNSKLDVRLPDELKATFLNRCRENGVSSGWVIRSLMFDYMERPKSLSARVSGLKELMMRRTKWMAGITSGGLVASLAGASLLFAPSASADEVVLNYFIQLTTPDGTGNSVWQGDFGTDLNGPVTVLPLQRHGSNPHSIEVLARPCDADAAPSCDVIFEIALYSYDLIDEGQEGQIASRVMTTRFGSGASFAIELEDGRTLAGHSVPVESTSDS